MPLTVNATPNDPTANSLLTVAEFQAYCAARLPPVLWLATATADYLAATVITASRLISAAFDWTGTAATPSSTLTWGRNGMLDRNGAPIDPGVIPDDLKAATAEFGIAIGAAALTGGGRLDEQQAAKQNVASVKAGSVEVRMQPVDSAHVEAVDIQIRRQWPEFAYVSNAVPDSVRFLLPASWYVRVSVRYPIMFRVA